MHFIVLMYGIKPQKLLQPMGRRDLDQNWKLRITFSIFSWFCVKLWKQVVVFLCAPCDSTHLIHACTAWGQASKRPQYAIGKPWHLTVCCTSSPANCYSQKTWLLNLIKNQQGLLHQMFQAFILISSTRCTKDRLRRLAPLKSCNCTHLPRRRAKMSTTTVAISPKPTTAAKIRANISLPFKCVLLPATQLNQIQQTADHCQESANIITAPFLCSETGQVQQVKPLCKVWHLSHLRCPRKPWC